MNKPKHNFEEETVNIDEQVLAKIYKLKDETLVRIQLILKENEDVIGDLYKTNFSNGNNFNIEDHLYNEVDDNFRGKGYGQKMFNLWLENKGFLPKLEYTNLASSILFLLKNNYELFGYHKLKGKYYDFETYKDENQKEEEINNLKKILYSKPETRLEKIYVLKLKK